MSYVKMDDYRQENGHIDWAAYKQAQKSAGEICYVCGGYIITGFARFNKSIGPEMCYDCRQLKESSGDVDSENYIRCPKCKTQMDVYETECYRLYEEGEHTATCEHCDAEFEIVTKITYTFTSPALEIDEEEKLAADADENDELDDHNEELPDTN